MFSNKDLSELLEFNQFEDGVQFEEFQSKKI